MRQAHLLPSQATTALTAILFAIAGCGGSSKPPTTPTPTPVYPALTGNWEGLPSSPPGSNPPIILSYPVIDLTGSLQSSGPTVTGIFRASNSNLNPCVSSKTDLIATGTVDPAGNLSLTVPIAGGTGTITTTLLANLQFPSIGTFQITGGPCDMPAHPFALLQVPPLTGTYTGTLQSPTLITFPSAQDTTPQINIAATLTQSTAPNTDGQFPLTGSISLTGGCTISLPITDGIVYGQNASFTVSEPSMPSGSFTGLITAVADHLHIFFISIPACGTQLYSGTLTRQ
jgi:hypothetical protein